MAKSRKRVLILLAHPNLAGSRVNGVMAKRVEGIEGVTLHDLYAAYPDFQIDIDYEQSLLRSHDIVLMQHPFYWYSAPALMKQWKDVVLQRGFAFGEGEMALKGKQCQQVISSGSPETAYSADGHNRFAYREFLRPFEQTAHLCGMEYLPPWVVSGVAQLSDQDVIDKADAYAAYVQMLVSEEG